LNKVLAFGVAFCNREGILLTVRIQITMSLQPLLVLFPAPVETIKNRKLWMGRTETRYLQKEIEGLTQSKTAVVRRVDHSMVDEQRVSKVKRSKVKVIRSLDIV